VLRQALQVQFFKELRFLAAFRLQEFARFHWESLGIRPLGKVA
jgi:hypothetical protein